MTWSGKDRESVRFSELTRPVPCQGQEDLDPELHMLNLNCWIKYWLRPDTSIASLTKTHRTRSHMATARQNEHEFKNILSESVSILFDVLLTRVWSRGVTTERTNAWNKRILQGIQGRAGKNCQLATSVGHSLLLSLSIRVRQICCHIFQYWGILA